MRIWIIIAIVVVVLILIYIFVIKPKSDAAMIETGAAAGASAVVVPTSAYAPGSTEAAMATAKHPIVCKNKCRVLHPFSAKKRAECETKCKQSGAVA